MFLFDVLHLLNEFHVFTSPIKTFISMGVIFILSEVLCWHVAWSVKCICLFQPSRNSIKTLRTSNETTKLWWNRYYIYFVNKNSNESDSILDAFVIHKEYWNSMIPEIFIVKSWFLKWRQMKIKIDLIYFLQYIE